MPFYVYILASRRNGTLYTGSTDDPAKRVYDHKQKARDGFTAKYDVSRLAWHEVHETRDSAFCRKRQIKEWKRLRKLELIESVNPQTDDP